MRFKPFLIATIILIIAVGAIYLYFDKILIFSASKIYDLDISYKSLIKDGRAGYKLENLKIFNKKMGVGFFSARASLKLLWKWNFLKTLDFDFKFKDVHFINNKMGDKKASYDTIEGLVSVPFEGRWTYKEISGVVEIFSNGLTLKKFSAEGKEIKLFLSGDLFYNNAVDMNVTILFSKHVLKDIPPELPEAVMKDEPEEWKSFSVKLTGDYSSPAVQISGKQFILNIGEFVAR